MYSTVFVHNSWICAEEYIACLLLLKVYIIIYMHYDHNAYIIIVMLPFGIGWLFIFIFFLFLCFHNSRSFLSLLFVWFSCISWCTVPSNLEWVSIYLIFIALTTFSNSIIFVCGYYWCCCCCFDCCFAHTHTKDSIRA